MSGINSKIQKKEFERRLHILKGFSNIEEVATVQIAELEKAVGVGNIYETSGLKKMTEDVLNKGDKVEIFKVKKFISNLHPVNVLDEDGLPTTLFIEKGHMDFGSGKPKNSNLVQKKVIDKNGHQTTRYVKNGEDAKEDMSDQSDIDKETSESDAKTNEDWVSETSTKDLEKFIMSDADDDLKELAESELASREANGMLNDDKRNSSNPDDIDSDSDTDADVDDTNDLSNPENLNNYVAQNREALLDIMVSDPNLSAAAAAKIHQAGNGSNEETHAKIDAAQAALDDLKVSAGHPDGFDPNEQEYENSEDKLEDFQMHAEMYTQGDESGGDIYDLAEEAHAAGMDKKSALSFMESLTRDEDILGSFEIAFDDYEAPDADSYNESGSDLNDIASHFGEDAATMVERTIKPEGFGEAYEFLAANPEALEMSDEDFTIAFLNDQQDSSEAPSEEDDMSEDEKREQSANNDADAPSEDDDQDEDDDEQFQDQETREVISFLKDEFPNFQSIDNNIKQNGVEQLAAEFAREYGYDNPEYYEDIILSISEEDFGK